MAIRSRVGSCEWTAQLDPVTGVREDVCRLKRAPGNPHKVGRSGAKERREPRSGRTGRFSVVEEGRIATSETGEEAIVVGPSAAGRNKDGTQKRGETKNRRLGKTMRRKAAAGLGVAPL